MVAQLVEHTPDKGAVSGSSPLHSTSSGVVKRFHARLIILKLWFESRPRLQCLQEVFIIKEVEMKVCLHPDCNNPIKNSRKYCSLSCAAKHSNILRTQSKRTCQFRGCTNLVNSYENYCEKCAAIIAKERKQLGIKFPPLKNTPRQKLKLQAVKYKGGKCEICGYDTCQTALEFHHLDPNEKDFAISKKSTTFEKIKPELDKCIMVCSNCHKEIHESQRIKI